METRTKTENGEVVVRQKTIKEDVPTNAIGSGNIAMFDPLLGNRRERSKKRIKSMWRRMLEK